MNNAVKVTSIAGALAAATFLQPLVAHAQSTQAPYWTHAAPASLARQELYPEVLDGKIYVADFVYVAEGYANSCSKWDVSNPRSPQLVVRWSVGGFAHSLWPSADGEVVVSTEELPHGLPARVWRMDGTNPPQQVATIQVSGATPHNVVFEGRRAFVSHYTEGALVVDLDDPAAPRMAAKYDTNPLTGARLAGCWGVYKFPGVPLMACSDTSTGFNLLRLTN